MTECPLALIRTDDMIKRRNISFPFSRGRCQQSKIKTKLPARLHIDGRIGFKRGFKNLFLEMIKKQRNIFTNINYLNMLLYVIFAVTEA